MNKNIKKYQEKQYPMMCVHYVLSEVYKLYGIELNQLDLLKYIPVGMYDKHLKEIPNEYHKYINLVERDSDLGSHIYKDLNEILLDIFEDYNINLRSKFIDFYKVEWQYIAYIEEFIESFKNGKNILLGVNHSNLFPSKEETYENINHLILVIDIDENGVKVLYPDEEKSYIYKFTHDDIEEAIDSAFIVERVFI